jgi:biopolymer transport protein ExbD
MAGHRKKKNKGTGGEGSIELNVMPFIDVFSLLTTFLLFSAVFVQIGILEVQVPFLSNSNPPDMDKPSRDLEIKLDLRKDYVEIQTAYTQPPINETKDRFKLDDKGFARFHSKLVELRQANPKNDKLTLFSDDDVAYEVLARILDETKFLKESDPKDIGQPKEQKGFTTGKQNLLFPKVVMGSVML